MDIVTIDFETYYDKSYTLSKMTTEAYIRDSRFEVIGVGVKVNDHSTDWYSGDDTRGFLTALDYSDKAILAHNAAFDGAILSWIFGIKPKLWLDTMSMARPLHNVTVGGSLKALVAHYGLGQKGEEVLNNLGRRRKDFTPEQLDKYADYCINDVELTYKLFKELKKGFPPSELMVIDQTIRMYTQPTIQLDADVLARHLNKIKADKIKLIDALALKGLGKDKIKKALMSNNIFAKLLTLAGVDPPMKISPRTGKESFAFAKTDAEFTALLEHPDLRVQTLVAARLGTKSTIEETRTENLIKVAERGALPIMLKYYGAHTGRFSGGDKLNLQNLPSNGGIRKALTAQMGDVLIVCDLSQIEARLVAYIAGQKDLVDAFREGRDVYSEFASDIYGRKVTKADKMERFVGKTCILGLGYGMGHLRFRDSLACGKGGLNVNIDENEAQRIVRLYRQKNHKIVELWDKCAHALTTMVSGGSGNITALLPYDTDGILLPNGLRIRYNALRQTPDGFKYIRDARSYRNLLNASAASDGGGMAKWEHIYGAKVTENSIQALARAVICEQMVAIGRRYQVVLQVHDDIVITCPENEKAAAREFVEREMSKPPRWAGELPIACESGVGYTYDSAK